MMASGSGRPAGAGKAGGVVLVCTIAALCASCTAAPSAPSAPSHPRTSAPARSVVLITIDTLRADHVGAYGARTARTPTLDALAREGTRFDKAWAAAPITLTSHASLLSGRYPPGHRARHNGIAVDPSVPTLATALKSAGFATAAFVSAFPLDQRFGLRPGFDVYDDALPRGADGRPLNERPGADTASRAIAWLQAHRTDRFFLWVHFFEPHAPYGDAASETPALTRYDEEIADGGSRGGTRAGRARRRGRVDARDRRGGSRRGLRRARRDWAQHLRLRHDASRAAPDARTVRARGPRGRGRRVAGGRGAHRVAAARREGDGHRRPVARARARRRRPRGPRDLRGILRAPLRLWMGGPARGARRHVEVHRRAEAGTLRPDARSRGGRQPRRRRSPARRALRDPGGAMEPGRAGCRPCRPAQMP